MANADNKNGEVLPVVQHTHDLGIVMTSDLSLSLHVSEIVAKGYKRAAVIHRALISRDVNVLLHAFLVFFRPLPEFSSVIWSPCTVKDIPAIKSIQRHFTKVYLVLKRYMLS